MTMPVERTRSVIQMGNFLRELSKNQQLSESSRLEVERLLRHYPDPRLRLYAAWLREVIRLKASGAPRRELAISGYQKLFSSSLDE